MKITSVCFIHPYTCILPPRTAGLIGFQHRLLTWSTRHAATAIDTGGDLYRRADTSRSPLEGHLIKIVTWFLHQGFLRALHSIPAPLHRYVIALKPLLTLHTPQTETPTSNIIHTTLLYRQWSSPTRDFHSISTSLIYYRYDLTDNSAA